MPKAIKQLEIATVSSKGQLVIPKGIRDNLCIKTGDLFAAASSNDILILKKLNNPIKEADIKTLKQVDEAWEDIEKGRYKTATLDEFMKEVKEW